MILTLNEQEFKRFLQTFIFHVHMNGRLNVINKPNSFPKPIFTNT